MKGDFSLGTGARALRFGLEDITVTYGYWGRVVVFVAVVFPLFGLTGSAGAQGFSQAPGLSDPSYDYGYPGGNDGIPVSSGMLAPLLPKIPNLQLGFLYYFGKNVRAGRFTADYVLPYSLSTDSVVFGEAHAEGWNFWKMKQGRVRGNGSARPRLLRNSAIVTC